MKRLKTPALLLVVLISTFISGCEQPTVGECAPCQEHLWLRIYFAEDTTATHTFVFNGVAQDKAVPLSSDPTGRFVHFRFDAPLPETVDIQVYYEDELKLDTTLVPQYEPTFNECLQEIDPECLAANEDVYVTQE